VNLTQVRARLAKLRAELATVQAADFDDLDIGREAALHVEIARLEGDEAELLAADGGEATVVRSGRGGGDSRSRLAGRANVADVLDHVVHSRPVTGATAELQADLGVGANVVPFELLRRAGSAPGHPNAALSTVSSTGDRQVQERTEPQVFPSALSAAFGVDRRTVGVGSHAVPVVNSPLAGPSSTVAIGTTVGDDMVLIEGHVLQPQRLQVSALIGRDELATFAGLADDVESTLVEALTSALDRQCLYGRSAPGGGGNPVGLLNHPADPADPAAVVDYAAMVAAVLDAVDGRYAPSAGDLAALFGPATYTLGLRLYRGDHDAESAAEKIQRLTAGLITSAHVLDPTAGGVQDAVVARGGRMHTGQAQRIWGGGVEVIADPYTASADGQVRLTAVVMMATALLRPDMYRRRRFDLTA